MRAPLASIVRKFANFQTGAYTARPLKICRGFFSILRGFWVFAKNEKTRKINKNPNFCDFWVFFQFLQKTKNAKNEQKWHFWSILTFLQKMAKWSKIEKMNKIHSATGGSRGAGLNLHGCNLDIFELSHPPWAGPSILGVIFSEKYFLKNVPVIGFCFLQKMRKNTIFHFFFGEKRAK